MPENRMSPRRSLTRLLCHGLVVLACGVGGCGRGPSPSATDPVDLTGVPVPRDLREELDAARRSARAPRIEAPAAADLARYDDLMGRIQDLATREQAGDDLYALWRADPTSFLWIDLATRMRALLQRETDRKAMYALPALADSHTVAGAYVLGRRYYGYGDRGRYYRLAEARMARADSLQQVWLTVRLAMVDAAEGRDLAAVDRLLGRLPQARAVGGAGLEAELWGAVAAYLRQGDRLDGALHAAVMAFHLARSAGLDYAQTDALLALAGVLADRRETAAARGVLVECADRCEAHGFLIQRTVALERAAFLLTTVGQVRDALDLTLRSVAGTIAVGDSSNAPRTLINAADGFRRLGELDSCRVYLDRARRWVDLYPTPPNVAALPAKLAPYYCQIGDYATADSLLKLAAAQAGGIGSHAYEAGIQLHLLDQALDLDQIDLAYRSIARLDELRPSLSDESVLADLALAEAEFYTRQGQLGRAREALDTAVPLVASRPTSARSWTLDLTAGKLAMLRGDLDGAQAAFTRALATAESTDDADWLAISRYHLGEILLDQGRYGDARALFDAAPEDAYGPRFRTQLASRFVIGRSWLREGEPSRALDELRAARTACARSAPSDLLARLQLETARAEAASGRPELALAAANEALATWDRRSRGIWIEEVPDLGGDLRHDAQEFLIGLLVDHPDLGPRDDIARRTLAVTGARADGLPPGAGAMATYFVGRQRSWVWIRSHDAAVADVTCGELPARADLERVVLPVIAGLERPGRPADATALRRAADILLGPVASRWRAGETLAIEPDDFLTAVPWAALPLPDGTVALERGPIVEVARPGVHSPEAATARATPARAALILGCNGSAGNSLRDAEAEARQVAAMWPEARRDLRVGDQARWERLAGLDLPRFDVIHVATHAVAFSGLPSSATLTLAGGDEGRPLTLDAIRRLPLNARLVYLSCCEGAGRQAGGVDSVVRAFLDAGSACVVASTIRVDDQAALHLAGAFYPRWLAGESAPAALRAALLDLRNARAKWSEPYYWAFYRVTVNELGE